MAIEMPTSIRVIGSTARSGTEKTFTTARSCCTPSKALAKPCNSSASPRWSSSEPAVVLALCQTPLLKLIARCNGVDMAFDGSSYQPNCDVHAPLMSLPAIFGTTLDTLPAQVPYLVTDKLLVDHWGAELAKAIGRCESGDGALPADRLAIGHGREPFRIGIAWQGNPAHSNDRWRSFPTGQLRAAGRAAGRPADQPADRPWPGSAQGRGPAVPGHRAAGRRCRDFMETAAIMTHLDLVITPDTAVAHLAGGLGLRSLDRPLHRGRVALARRPRRHARGIPPCDCSVRPRSAIGTASSGA